MKSKLGICKRYHGFVIKKYIRQGEGFFDIVLREWGIEFDISKRISLPISIQRTCYNWLFKEHRLIIEIFCFMIMFYRRNYYKDEIEVIG